MMYKRSHHQRIDHVLQKLDPNILEDYRCYFGGGTAMALRYGEYRESVDMDFLVSDQKAFFELRNLVRRDGLKSLWIGGAIEHSEIRVDRYGLRTRVQVMGEWIKFEVVHEGRVSLDVPNDEDRLSGIKSLTPLDMVTSKLLANSDRWPDRGVFNRDIIDLAMMSPSAERLKEAHVKAQDAYGDSVGEDLKKAIQCMEDQSWLERCRTMLSMEVSRAVLWNKIRCLGRTLA